jgi:hypothetical protein
MNVDEEDPVTNLKEAKMLLDPPKWFSEGKRGAQIKETAESLKSAVDENYDHLLGSKAGSKRKRESEADAKAAAKKEDAENKLAGMDWHAMLAGGTLKKATVPQLKAYCATNGLKGTGKKVSLFGSVGVCRCVCVFVCGWVGGQVCGCGWAFTCVLDSVRICVLRVDVCVFCMVLYGFFCVGLGTCALLLFTASVQRQLARSLENG